MTHEFRQDALHATASAEPQETAETSVPTNSLVIPSRVASSGSSEETDDLLKQFNKSLELRDERAAARKKAKNKKASKRWRAKKEEARKALRRNVDPDGGGGGDGELSQDTRGAIEKEDNLRRVVSLSSERMRNIESSLSSLPVQQRKDVEDMLYEFKRLGKVQETNLKRPLNEIASFSLISGGFQGNKSEIVRLCEEVVNAARGGPVSAKETATRFVHLLGQEQPFWKPRSNHLEMIQVLKAFANGQDCEVFIKMPGKQRPISLAGASCLNQQVTTRWHLSLVKVIQAQLPVVSSSDQSAVAVGMETISLAMSTLGAIALSWAIGHASSFSTMRAIKVHPPNPQGPAIRKVLAELDPDLRAMLWHHWDVFSEQMPSLLGRMHEAESRLDECLSKLDTEGDRSMFSAFHAVKHLMACYTDLMEATFIMDARCSFSLTLVQLGIWLALDLPEDPVEDMIRNDVDPYLKITNYFASGAIPRE